MTGLDNANHESVAGLSWAQRCTWASLWLARQWYHRAFRQALDAGTPEDMLAAELCDMALTAGALLQPYEVEL